MVASTPVTQALLDSLWDFADPAASEQRLRAAAADAASAEEAAELTTQTARALGLQGRFDEAIAMLDTVTASSPVVEVRVALERGRIRNSSGAAAEAMPYFTHAARLADAAGLLFLHIDALHMLGIADEDRAEEWMLQAMPLAADAADARTRRWLVSLHNNLGWLYFDRGDLAAALAEFEATAAAAQEVGTDEQRVWAAEAIEECRAAMTPEAR